VEIAVITSGDKSIAEVNRAHGNAVWATGDPMHNSGVDYRNCDLGHVSLERY